jgi:hypothetical protein
MGLWHFGHVGGGGFFGMTLRLERCLLTVTECRRGLGGDGKIVASQDSIVCPVPDSNSRKELQAPTKPYRVRNRGTTCTQGGLQPRSCAVAARWPP